MAIANVDNVVSLNKYQRGKFTNDTVGVLNDCRDVALKRVCEVIAKAFDSIEEELFGMAQGARDRESQNLFLDARAQTREKRTLMEEAFRKQFVGFFNGKARGEPDAAPGNRETDFSALNLSLVSESDLEETIAVADMTKRLKSSCEEELSALSQRMGFLLHDPELSDDANPMNPEMVSLALKDACDQITSGYRVKLTILKLFEQHLAKDILDVYRDINSHLVTRYQILPQVRPAYRRSSPPLAHVPKPGPEADAGVAAHPSTKAAENTPADLFATMRQLFLQSGTAGSVPGTSAVTAHNEPASAAPLPTQGLVNALTQIQYAGLPGANATDSAVPTMDSAQLFNALREIKARGVAEGADQLDNFTLDIVAMLFDYVFEDRQIPDTIKALLGRLQIPILKIALLDKSFFSRKSHPARMLMDKLAQVAIECDENIRHDDPLYRHIESIVESIQTGFDTDVALFVEQIEKLDTFIAERETEEACFVEQSARLVHEREKNEIARLVSESAINQRLANKTLPISVVVMLKGRWVDVLKTAHLRGGEDCSQWRTGCQTIEELIWSVEPKLNADDRKQLVSLLPSLLKRLQDGMRIASVEQAERERFFSALVANHATAVKAGLNGNMIGISSAAQPGWIDATSYADHSSRNDPLQASAEPGVSHVHIESDGVKIEEIRLHKQTAGSAPNVETTGDSVTPAQIKRGTWVEFQRANGEIVRAKLTWTSPLKGIYLFTNPQVAGAVSVTPDALAAQLRDGHARVLEDTPLMDRAVDKLMGTLRENQAH